MIVCTKKGEINVVVEHDKLSTAFKLVARDDEQNDMGFLIFYVEKNADFDRCWLNVVETKPDFARRCVGTALLAGMEFIATKKFHVNNIVGAFMPFRKGKGNRLKPVNQKILDETQKFYEKNDYDVRVYSGLLQKQLVKKPRDFANMIKCSYDEFMSYGIDFETLEELNLIK